MDMRLRYAFSLTLELIRARSTLILSLTIII